MAEREKNSLRVAILDMYEGFENQGMRCIREILNQYADSNSIDVDFDEFEVRLEKQSPDLSYDIYISSGGPGSPLESEGSDWEKVYFNWLDQVERYNRNPAHVQKKKVFFICHSFQLICRHYKVGHVAKRKSTAFGIFPIHLMQAGKDEPTFSGLRDPFIPLIAAITRSSNPIITAWNSLAPVSWPLKKKDRMCRWKGPSWLSASMKT